MSKTQRPLPEAERIAAAIVADLAPSCDRIQVAGSVRRRKEVVGDIELVLMPHHAPAGLFGAARPTSSGRTCTPATPTASPKRTARYVRSARYKIARKAHAL